MNYCAKYIVLHYKERQMFNLVLERQTIFYTIQHVEDSSPMALTLILFWMLPMRLGVECLYPVIPVIPEIASLHLGFQRFDLVLLRLTGYSFTCHKICMLRNFSHIRKFEETASNNNTNYVGMA